MRVHILYTLRLLDDVYVCINVYVYVKQTYYEDWQKWWKKIEQEKEDGKRQEDI